VAPDAACRARALVSWACASDAEGGLLLAAYHSSRRLGNYPLIRAAFVKQKLHLAIRLPLRLALVTPIARDNRSLTRAVTDAPWPAK